MPIFLVEEVNVGNTTSLEYRKQNKVVEDIMNYITSETEAAEKADKEVENFFLCMAMQGGR